MWTPRIALALIATALLLACGPKQPSSAPIAKGPALEIAPGGGQLATGAQPTSEPLPVGNDDPTWGSPNAPVTIIEFSDLQCPFCSRVHPTIKALQAKYGPNQLRVVFKHMPLPFHQDALPAAKVADAVFRQGGSTAFFSYLDLAFSAQMELSKAQASWVARVGLDPNVVMQRAQLPETAAKIQADIDLAERVGANGTPAFRINGLVLSGAQPIEEFTRLIDAELAATGDLLKKGVAASDLYKARVATNFSAPKPGVEEKDEEDLSVWSVPVKGAPFEGPADALVTIVEFSDYQCPFCRRVQNTLNELRKKYPNDVRIVLRQNPLPFHPRARPAANLALEARAQKGDVAFLEANRRLYIDDLEDKDLLALAKELKLDEKKAKAAITNNTHDAEIETDVALAQDFEARGTPHFFINGVRLSGAQPLPNFVALVDAQLKVASALVAQGTPRGNVYEEIIKRGKEPAAPETKSVPAPTADNPTRGPVKAPIVIHVFSDFQCPFCGRVEPTLVELDKAFPNQLRWVWHDLPLGFHEHARPAAVFAREVRAQKGDAGFWKVHDLMFRDQKEPGALEQTAFDKYAAELKLDTKRATLAQTDGRHDAIIDKDIALSQSVGINGTPAFVINGFYVSGAQPLVAFKRAVRRAQLALSKPTAQLAKP